jgi:hypothetical protein
VVPVPLSITNFRDRAVTRAVQPGGCGGRESRADSESESDRPSGRRLRGASCESWHPQPLSRPGGPALPDPRVRPTVRRAPAAGQDPAGPGPARAIMTVRVHHDRVRLCQAEPRLSRRGPSRPRRPRPGRQLSEQRWQVCWFSCCAPVPVTACHLRTASLDIL